MKVFKFIQIAVLSILMLGCASARLTTGFAELKSDNKKATIYIYRLDTSIHSLNPDIPVFYLNGKEVGPLNIGGYYAQQVDEGTVEINYKENGFLWLGYLFPSKKIKVVAKAGKSYFVKYEVALMGTFFDFVPHEFGIQDIRSTKLLIK